MVLGVLFGTWMWTNLTMAGAWQLALGFAMVGELGAIYFTIYDRRPFIAGLFFALAFGNRTEVLLTAPIFFGLLARGELESDRSVPPGSAGGAASNTKSSPKMVAARPPAHAGGTDLWPPTRLTLYRVATFCIFPFVLGVATLVYNYIRFHSFTDFGYARIPGVLNEPWYNHGIFSYHYIPRQIWEMLLRAWETRATFPYITPNPFSSSILWSSPFLLFAFRRGAARQGVEGTPPGWRSSFSAFCSGCTAIRADGSSDIVMRWFVCHGCSSSCSRPRRKSSHRSSGWLMGFHSSRICTPRGCFIGRTI